jgi:tetratricopeptide (TPR) repeat protein
MNRFRWIVLAAVVSAAASSANAKDEKWVEARSPNFIVVSNASPQQARNTAIQFEQIRALFQNSMAFAKDHPTPVITILAAKDEKTLASLLPEYWATKGRVHPAGIFLDYLYQRQVAVQLSGMGDNPYEAIYHEYYHSLTLPYFPGLPLWVAEGMADLFGNSKISGKTASLGMADPGLIEQLHEQALIPLPVLFHVDHTSPYYNESNKVTIFYAESWALIHYLMLGDNGAHRPQFTAYLDALSHGESQDAAAAKAFGDLAKLQKALQSYAGNNAFYELQGPAPARISESDVQVRDLSESEAEAYRGGFLAMHQQFNEADSLLQNAVRSDPKLALAQRNLAFLYYQQSKFDEARAALDAAIALDPKDSLTHFLRAELASGGRSAELEDSSAISDLRAAIAANPDFAPAYGLLSNHLAARGENLDEALEIAKKGVQLEPGIGSYQLALANVLARMHQYDQALAIAARTAANPLDPQAKANAEQFVQYVQNLRNAEAMRGQYRGAPPPASTRVDTTVESAAADSSGTDADTDDEEEAPAKDGKRRIDGTITDVQCKVQDMVITVQTADGPVKLHAPDNRKVDYISDVKINSEVFWPCTVLKGHVVHAKFLPAATNAKTPYQGELTGVEIRK